MQITKEGRHEYSKKRRKLVRKGLNPYDDAMLFNLDKEWVKLRTRIDSIKHINCGTLALMNEFETTYYHTLGIDTDIESIIYEVNMLRSNITDLNLIQELEIILNKLVGEQTKNSLICLKRMVVRLQASVNLPIHFYEALDDEYREVYQDVINDNFKKR